jgi:glycosyltransferase involved in cell wall biosynthesis
MAAERRRVLVVTPFPPRRDGRHGGSRAVAQLAAGLAERHAVALVSLRDHREPGVDEALRDACDLVVEVEIPEVGRSLGARARNKLRILSKLYRGLPSWAVQRSAPGFEARLAEVADTWRPDLVQLEYRIMGQFLAVLRDRGLPCVLVDPDPDGPDSVSLSFVTWPERRAWASLGRAGARQVDAFVVFTERDRRLVLETAPAAPVVCIPLGFDIGERPADPVDVEDPRIVWVGSFVHPPNVDAAFRLARAIFPAVRARVPDASLDLVGSLAAADVRALAGDGVIVSSDVPDVRPHLDSAAVFAAPVHTGGGMRVKILEALAAGKAIVATPLALEGLALQDGEQVRVVRSDGDFVDAVVDLLLHPEQRAVLGRAARAWAEQHLGVDAQVRAYEDLYAEVLGRTTASSTG